MATAMAAGVSLTARQLARWRQLGLIPSPSLRSLGRGKGRQSSYPADVSEYVIELAKRNRKGTPLHETVLWMFRDGVAVPDGCLRRALHVVVRTVFATSVKFTGSTDPDDIAAAFASFGATARHSPSVQKHRASITESYRDLQAEDRWFYVEPEEDRPTRQEHVRAAFGSLYHATHSPDLVDYSGLDGISRALLDHGPAQALGVLHEPAPDAAELLQILPAFSESALESLIDAVDVDHLRDIARWLQIQTVLPDFSISPGVRPRGDALLAPLLLAAADPQALELLMMFSQVFEDFRNPLFSS